MNQILDWLEEAFYFGEGVIHFFIYETDVEVYHMLEDWKKYGGYDLSEAMKRDYKPRKRWRAFSCTKNKLLSEEFGGIGFVLTNEVEYRVLNYSCWNEMGYKPEKIPHPQGLEYFIRRDVLAEEIKEIWLFERMIDYAVDRWRASWEDINAEINEFARSLQIPVLRKRVSDRELLLEKAVKRAIWEMRIIAKDVLGTKKGVMKTAFYDDLSRAIADFENTKVCLNERIIPEVREEYFEERIRDMIETQFRPAVYRNAGSNQFFKDKLERFVRDLLSQYLKLV